MKKSRSLLHGLPPFFYMCLYCMENNSSLLWQGRERNPESFSNDRKEVHTAIINVIKNNFIPFRSKLVFSKDFFLWRKNVKTSTKREQWEGTDDMNEMSGAVQRMKKQREQVRNENRTWCHWRLNNEYNFKTIERL